MNVHQDGTRDSEVVRPDHPVVGPLADLIEGQLSVEIIMKQLGVAYDEIDQDGLRRIAFSVAEEIDFYYSVERRTKKGRRN